MEIMRIKSTHKPSQGDFVEINKSDFNPKTMEVYDPEAEAAGGDKVTAAQLKEKLTAAGIEFKGNASKAELQALVDTIQAPE